MGSIISGDDSIEDTLGRDVLDIALRIHYVVAMLSVRDVLLGPQTNREGG
jgi:hypothetical protein